MEPSIAGDLMNEEMQTENQFNLKFQSGTAGGTGTEMGINGAPNLPVFESVTSINYQSPSLTITLLGNKLLPKQQLHLLLVQEEDQDQSLSTLSHHLASPLSP